MSDRFDLQHVQLDSEDDSVVIEDVLEDLVISTLHSAVHTTQNTSHSAPHLKQEVALEMRDAAIMDVEDKPLLSIQV